MASMMSPGRKGLRSNLPMFSTTTRVLCFSSSLHSQPHDHRHGQDVRPSLAHCPCMFMGGWVWVVGVWMVGAWVGGWVGW